MPQYFKMLGTNYTMSHSTRLKSSRVTYSSSLNNFVKKITSIKISNIKLENVTMTFHRDDN